MIQYFITGTSRGIGFEMAKELLKRPESELTGLSRSNEITHDNFKHISMDLNNLEIVSTFNFPELSDYSKVVLVNNAGSLGEMKHLGKYGDKSIVETYNLNVIAPVLLMNRFLAAYLDKQMEIVILNVSSGASKNPTDGWSVYCSSKAALEMASLVVFNELQMDNKENTHVFSIAPGIVDTKMQEEIRAAHVEDFSRVSDFVAFKANKALKSPYSVALDYIKILDCPENYKEPIFRL